jgi:hypothetical protein
LGLTGANYPVARRRKYPEAHGRLPECQVLQGHGEGPFKVGERSERWAELRLAGADGLQVGSYCGRHPFPERRLRL